MKDALN